MQSDGKGIDGDRTVVWLFGIALGYFVRRNSREHDIVFLVTGSIAIGAFIAGVSGEIFEFTLYLIFDVLQALIAAAAGYCGKHHCLASPVEPQPKVGTIFPNAGLSFCGTAFAIPYPPQSAVPRGM